MAQERCEGKRALFGQQIAQVPVEKLVFLDECGFALNLHALNLSRLYGWTIGGGPCLDPCPDLNPIELAWSWIKQRVRTLAPRDDAQRQKDISCAGQQLPPEAAQA